MTQNSDSAHEGERCMDCKRPYDLVWAAENALWNEVVGSSHGQLCPDCFDRRCNERGIYPFFVAHREHAVIGDDHAERVRIYWEGYNDALDVAKAVFAEKRAAL